METQKKVTKTAKKIIDLVISDPSITAGWRIIVKP